MKQFNLEEYLRMKEAGKEPRIVTRDGLSVRIICTDNKNRHGFVVVGLTMWPGEDEFINSFRTDGTYGSSESKFDLFFADLDPEPKYRPYKDAEEFMRDFEKHGGWVKFIVGGEVYCTYAYHTKTCLNGTLLISGKSAKAMLDEDNARWCDDDSPFGVKED